MKKSLIALAVAGALAAPVAAMADTANVTIYGHANVSYDLTKNGDGTAVNNGTGAVTAGNNQTKVSDNVSYIGLKGSEDMGGGTSAVWQLESAVSLDAAAGNTLGTRNSFAGLSNEGMGTLILGQHDTPYKIATRGLDLFADTIADNRSLMGMTGGGAANHDARLGNVVAYISPAMSGFTAAVAYVAGAETAIAAGNVKGSAWSLAGMYNAGPINASLAYQAIDAGTPGTGTMGALGLAANDKLKSWKIGGGYTMDQFTVNAAYEKTTSTIVALAGDAVAQGNWYLAGKFNVSASDAVKLAYTRAGKNPQAAGIVEVANSDANQISLGYDHSLSKRTTVYALYTKISNSAASTYGLATGITTGGVAAGNGTGAAGAFGADPSAISLGMKHTF